MAVAVKKYNPGFLTDVQIIDSFCVRTAEFESLVESLREIDAGSSPHSLVIGPRGSGKTHLLLRVAAEVRRNPALAGLFPVVFAEESYEVATCGEFWLECLGRLAEQADEDERESLRLTCQDLRAVSDDQALADRCIGSLLDFADRQDTRLVLIVENLNMLFSDIGDPDVGWQLRQTLQTEPRIILLAAPPAASTKSTIPSTPSTTYSGSLCCDHSTPMNARPSGRPLLGSHPPPKRSGRSRSSPAATRASSPSSPASAPTAPSATSWRTSSTSSTSTPNTSRATSNPSRPRNAASTSPSPASGNPPRPREIAALARLNTNACSAQLKRLVARGAVAVDGGTPRRRRYYMTERLYNIYYLLRRGTGTDSVVQALIDFMVCLYSPSEIGDIVESILESSHDLNVLPEIIGPEMAGTLLNEAHCLQEMGKNDDAIALYDQVIDRFGPDRAGSELQVGVALTSKSSLLIQIGRSHEAIVTCEEIVGKYQTGRDLSSAVLSASALWVKGMALIAVDNLTMAIDTFNRALAQVDTLDAPIPNFILAGLLHSKGLALVRLSQLDNALATFDEALAQYSMDLELQQYGTTAMLLIGKALVLDPIRSYD